MKFDPREWKRRHEPLQVGERPRGEPLHGLGYDWLGTLPESVCPYATAEYFPHVVNRLAWLWKDPSAFDAEIAKLMREDRSDGSGFPKAIVDEIRAVAQFHQAQRQTAG